MWSGAIAGGVIAGVGMGLIMQFVMNAMPLVGALYGQPTVVIGWLAHLFHSVVFALLFAIVVLRTSLREYGLLGIVGLGALYGVLLELVAAGFVLPIWANAVGAATLPVPFLIPIGFVTHLVYGVLLGVVFGVVMTRERSTMAASEPSEDPAT
jgi:riboflavin transporter FmnP